MWPKGAGSPHNTGLWTCEDKNKNETFLVYVCLWLPLWAENKAMGGRINWNKGPGPSGPELGLCGVAALEGSARHF